MCNVGNSADKIMCIHGFWSGINVTTINEIMAMKSQMCPTLRDSLLVETCMLRGIMDIPKESPLFQSSFMSAKSFSNFGSSLDSLQASKVFSHNISQANELLLHGVDQTHMAEFRETLTKYNLNWPIDIFIDFYSKIGLNGMLYAVETHAECELTACHFPCHNLGKAVYLKTLSLEVAVYVCGKSCNTGCFHGAMGQFFVSLYRSAPAGQGEKALVPYYSSLGQPNSMTMSLHGDGLFHAIGHAVMPSIANFDIPKGLAQCKMLPKKTWTYNCAVGGYMEYFHANFTPSGFAPCDGEGVDFPAACYRFVWPLVAHHYPTLLDGHSACLTVANNMERHGCFYGMGFVFAKRIWERNQTLAIAEICAHGDFGDRRMCVFGASNWPGPFARNETVLSAMCAPLPEGPLRSSCMLKGFDRFDDANIGLFFYTSEMRQRGEDMHSGRRRALLPTRKRSLRRNSLL